MGKSTHFSGQPLYGQVINLLDKSKIFQISRENGGERYTKRFNIWVTLIANLLLMVMQKGLKRQWSFSGLATMVRISLMYYVDFYSLFNNPEKDWENLLAEVSEIPPEPTLFD